MNQRSAFKSLTIGTLVFWLIVFELFPIAMIVLVSFSTANSSTLYTYHFSLDAYRQLFNPIYIHVLLRSVKTASITTVFCLLIGYPFAYILSRSKLRWKNLLFLFVIIPFWTSSLIRTYAMIAILKSKGIINSVLLHWGVIDHPLQVLFSNTAVIIGLVYNLLPFMIIPLYSNLEKLDYKLIEAAQDLGSNTWRTFFKIIIPMTKAGIIAGCILVFLPAMTIFYIPEILGGAKSLLMGNLIQDQFLFALNWPLGAASCVVLIVILLLTLGIFWRASRSNHRGALL